MIINNDWLNYGDGWLFITSFGSFRCPSDWTKEMSQPWVVVVQYPVSEISVLQLGR